MPSPLTARFPCPACGATLRLRDRRFVGATFPCPDCQAPLTLLTVVEGAATVQLAEPAAAPRPAPVRTGSSAIQQLQQRAVAVGSSPLFVGWGVAILFGATLLSLAMSSRRPTPTVTPIVANGEAARQAPEPEPPREPPVTPADHHETVPDQPAVVEAPVVPAPPPVIVPDLHADPPISALTALLPSAPQPVRVLPAAQTVLQQRLGRFEVSQPVPRRELLLTLEDLLGRRIDWDRNVPRPELDPLEGKVTLSLENATVADLAGRILEGTDLQLVVHPDGATLQPRTPTTGTADDVVIIPN